MAFKVGRCLLLKRLQEAHMTQQELADKVRMTRQQISDYVNNRKIMSLQTAKTIATAIDCTIEDLYEWVHVRKG